jgi:Flp pilus assembly CpaE family ATPase
MFPLSVVMVGCRLDNQLHSLLWQELRNIPAVVEAEFTGVNTMISQLPSSLGKQRLFILPVLGQHEIDELRLVQESFPSSPIMALIDINDANMILQANRAGVTQIVPIPVTPDDFVTAMDCIGKMFGQEVKYANVVAVSGVTGGCGATTLGVNLAYEVSQLPKTKCILSELAQVGVLSTYLRVKTNYTTDDLFTGGASRVDLRVVENALTEVTPSFFFLPGPDRSSIGQAPRTVEEWDQYLNYLRRLSTVSIIDLPCTFDDAYFERLELIDEVVLVAEQSVRSIRAMKLLKDTISRGGYRVHEAKYRYVINRYRPTIQGFQLDHLRGLLEHDELFTISNDYNSLSEALNRGKPLRMVNPKSVVLPEIDVLAKLVSPNIEPQEAEAKKSSKGLMGNFRKLIKTFGFK